MVNFTLRSTPRKSEGARELPTCPSNFSVGYLAQSQLKTKGKRKRKMPPLAFTRSGWGLLGHATTRVALAARRNPTNSRDRIKPNLSGIRKAREVNVRSCTIGRISDELEDESNHHGIAEQAEQTRRHFHKMPKLTHALLPFE